jgi:hypothetical protein
VDVTAAIASGGGTLSGAVTVTTDNSGAATFTDLVITGTTGDRTLSFTAGALSVTSGTISLAAGAPATITILTQPGGIAISGAALNPQPEVEVRDSAGNVVSGVTVTAALTPGPAGTLGGTADIVTDANGVATFTDLSITRAGIDTDFTIDFTVQIAPGVTVRSNNIIVF